MESLPLDCWGSVVAEMNISEIGSRQEALQGRTEM